MTAQEELSRRISRDGICRAVQKKIDEGRADFTDTARYTDRAAELLGEVLAAYVPDMPPDERETLCKALLRQRYLDTNAMLNAVQRTLDAAQGLHLAPQIADYPEERVDQAAHALADETVPVETIVRRAKSAPATIARSFHDDYIEKNAAFRDSAGLKCYITRNAAAKCCEWCTKMAGRYRYGEEPEDVYRRHDNCSCTVTYENGRKRQDVWSKREWEAPERGAGAPEAVRLTHEQVMQIRQEKQLHRMAPGEVVNSPLNILTNRVECGTMELAKMANPNQSEQIQWLPKGKELTSSERRELTDYAAAHGIILKGLKRTDVDIGLMKETIDIAASMLLRYPELNNNPDSPFTIKVVNGLEANTFAQATRYSNTNVVQLNANAFRNAQKLSEEYDKLVKRNWFPQGTTYRSIVIHEIGHIVERKSKVNTLSIIKSIVGSDDYSEIERYLVENLSEYSVNGSSFTGEVIPEVFNAFYGSSLSNQFAADFMAEFRKGDINDRLQ